MKLNHTGNWITVHRKINLIRLLQRPSRSGLLMEGTVQAK